MNVMDGLSHWLRQIIAVILLASLIDLLLPNRTMQRYVRLVAGLFILMTVATPILNWMKGDFGAKLADGLTAVEQEPMNAASRMAMIESDGAKLRDKQASQAADLVATRLEAAIRQEVERTEKRGVSRVDVSLERGADGSVQVAGVVVTLEPEHTGAEAGAGSGKAASEVKDVEPVDVSVTVEEWTAETGGSATADGGKAGGPAQGDVPAAAGENAEPDDGTRARVIELIVGRFGIPSRDIEVKAEPASDESRATKE
ncbi:stage III sporulation protein AF [Cohnella suwonensis]|uniref:Stage III sporulation protein AF n=1 Tax=Cohnella suwonensis TaxID=696072 RepID=A0ABW0LQ18_9BACL